MANSDKSQNNRNPEIILSADQVARMTASAESAINKNPALIHRLFGEISRAQIVQPDDIPADVIKIGSCVTYRDELTSVERTVTLVFPEEADITNRRVSVLTPIGVALLGLSIGSEFYWDTRENQRRMLVVTKVSPSTYNST